MSTCKKIWAEIFYGGKIAGWGGVDAKVTKGTAAGAGKGNFSESETEHRITVPDGLRWMLFYAGGKPDVNATLVIELFDDDDDIRGVLLISTAGVTLKTGPETAASAATEDFLPVNSFPLPLPGNWYLKFTFGANQGATAYCFAHFTEAPE